MPTHAGLDDMARAWVESGFAGDTGLSILRVFDYEQRATYGARYLKVRIGNESLAGHRSESGRQNRSLRSGMLKIEVYAGFNAGVESEMTGLTQISGGLVRESTVKALDSLRIITEVIGAAPQGYRYTLSELNIIDVVRAYTDTSTDGIVLFECEAQTKSEKISL